MTNAARKIGADLFGAEPKEGGNELLYSLFVETVEQSANLMAGKPDIVIPPPLSATKLWKTSMVRS